MDEDFEVHDKLSAMLRRHGIDSISAGSMTGAKAALDLCRVDAMLIDTTLGAQSGADVAAELKRLCKAPAMLLDKPLAEAKVEAALSRLF